MQEMNCGMTGLMRTLTEFTGLNLETEWAANGSWSPDQTTVFESGECGQTGKLAGQGCIPSTELCSGTND